MEIQIFIQKDGVIRGQVEKLLGLSERFILMEDKGKPVINVIDSVVFEPNFSVEQVFEEEEVTVYNSAGEAIFTGPPWREEKIGEFLVECNLLDQGVLA